MIFALIGFPESDTELLKSWCGNRMAFAVAVVVPVLGVGGRPLVTPVCSTHRWTLLCLSSRDAGVLESDGGLDSSIEASGERAFDGASDVAVGLALSGPLDLVGDGFGMAA